MAGISDDAVAQLTKLEGRNIARIAMAYGALRQRVKRLRLDP